MEERKGEDEDGGTGGQVLVMWESGRCTILVVVMNLLRHISFRDKMLPSGVVGRAPVLIGADDLVLSRLIFRGEVRSWGF